MYARHLFRELSEDRTLRAYTTRQLLYALPEEWKPLVRYFRQSPSLRRWQRIRDLRINHQSHGLTTLWQAAENANMRRIANKDKPTLREFDLTLYLYFYSGSKHERALG